LIKLNQLKKTINELEKLRKEWKSCLSSQPPNIDLFDRKLYVAAESFRKAVTEEWLELSSQDREVILNCETLEMEKLEQFLAFMKTKTSDFLHPVCDFISDLIDLPEVSPLRKNIIIWKKAVSLMKSYSPERFSPLSRDDNSILSLSLKFKNTIKNKFDIDLDDENEKFLAEKLEFGELPEEYAKTFREFIWYGKASKEQRNRKAVRDAEDSLITLSILIELLEQKIENIRQTPEAEQGKTAESLKALKQADELLELWDVGNKDSDAFNNGWNSTEGKRCPKDALERAASYLKQIGEDDAAKHIEAETKTLSERAFEFDYSYDGEPIPPVKKDVFDPLRNYLLVLIQKFEASDKTHLGSAKIKADNWEQVTIEVVDNDTIKYKVNDKKWERANCTELGFLDRRKHLPNNLWPRFLSLAEQTRPMPNPPNIKPKDIDRIRSTLRNFFGLQKIPIQYDSKNKKYSCMFKFYDKRNW